MAAQTRDNHGACVEWPSVSEAFEYALGDPEVWKVSFPDPGNSEKRIRLVRNSVNTWVYEPIEL